MKTEVTELLGIEYPIIQGGMAWVASGSSCFSSWWAGADWSRKRSCRLGSSAGTGGEKTHR